MSAWRYGNDGVVLAGFFSPRVKLPARVLKCISPQRRNSLLRNQCGFTLVEMIVTIALAVTLMAMSIAALSYYTSVRSLDAAASEIQTEIREAQALAVNSGNTYRLDFSDPSARTYTLQMRQNDTWVNVEGPMTLPSAVQFSTTSPPSFGGDEYLECYARGACEDGSLVLKNNRGATKTVQVDGETANVRIG